MRRSRIQIGLCGIVIIVYRQQLSVCRKKMQYLRLVISSSFAYFGYRNRTLRSKRTVTAMLCIHYI
ncbi:hypothetical protein AABM17_461 [Neisseria musculi]|uniref:Uncharacterized protein n=1 Tax=Neisseria musculi TaxID=1815583 RepID=A0A7H1MB87_9NEIS|nr:hypothetical protein H7A79_0461 [Neisseria musculi]